MTPTTPDYDFGYVKLASIGDRVWNDVNGDGVQDGGVEVGLNNVTVRLFDSGGGLVATEITSGDGEYLFEDLPADDYTVVVDNTTLPAGFVQTFDITAPLDDQATVTVAANDERTDVDFGYRQPPGSIGDRVWNDVDGDGVQDGGVEVGLNNVTVRLFDSGGGLVATEITSGDGMYLFEDLPADDYTVLVDNTTLPVGFAQTFDITPPLDDQASVTLGIDEDRDDVDFGYQQQAGSIGDRVWNDLDGDGVQDGTEVGINDVTVRLFDSGGGLVDTDVTSGDGDYLFENLPPDTYTVVVDASTLPVGFVQTFDVEAPLDNQADTILGPGDNRDDVDFGYAECGVCLGKVTRLTLRYLGTTTDAQIQVFAKKGMLVEEVFNGVVQPDGSFELVGLPTGTPGFSGTLGTEIEIFVDGVSQTVIHTSCSLPVGPGLISGDFEVMAGFSQQGGALCPVGDCTPIRVRDDFEIKSFSNNDGPDNWSGDWIENDPESGGAGPLAGQVQVHDGLLTLDDYPNTGGEPSAAREVDLEGAATASLSFTFATTSGVDTDDAVTVEISNDGGATWSTLEVLTGIYGAVKEERNYDISAFISSETQVRFRVSNKYGGSNELFCLFYVEIETDCGDCREITVADEFEVKSFSNNDGPDNWSGDWIEDDPEYGGAGPTAGQVQIHDGLLTLDDYPNTGGEPSAAREVNLEGAASASVSFTFATSYGVDPGDAVTVEVSDDGGATWTTLEVLTGIYGAVRKRATTTSRRLPLLRPRFVSGCRNTTAARTSSSACSTWRSSRTVAVAFVRS